MSDFLEEFQLSPSVKLKLQNKQRLKKAFSEGETVQQLMNNIPSYTDMFIGNMGGSLGEVSAAAILG